MTTSPRRAATAVFTRSVDALTLAELRSGLTIFADLVRRLPSIYPTEVLASLDRLADRGLIAPEVTAEMRRQAARRSGGPREGRSLLPLPHPLDYEWRFSSESSRVLLDLAADFSPRGGDVLLLGTPGLAVEALSLPIDRRLLFVGEDNVVTQRLITLNRATGSPLSIAFCREGLQHETAHAVLVDPPWYMDFIRPMLGAAAVACRMGGVVLISMPPAGTRPSAEQDRRAAIQFAARFGLELLEHQRLAIGYDTPFFEINALAAVGVCAPHRWRRGDLLVFRKAHASSRPAPLPSSRRLDWVEVTFGRMRLFIKLAAVTTDRFTGLLSLVEGDVLPSVSRRDSRRRDALVWTSGNRIFGSDNPALVLEAAVSHSGEDTAPSAQLGLWGNLRGEIERVGKQLVALAALEADEERGSLEILGERRRLWTSDSMSSCGKFMATASG
jgi:hypothetical protein